MTARDLLDRAIGKFEDILDVLGFASSNIKSRRACALCGATNKTTFSYRPDAGIWRCFRCDRRGGVLDLVQAALGCNRADALQWLADHLGVNLDDRQPLTPEEKRRYAQQRSRAALAAQNLTEWRRDTLRRLRGTRNPLYESENMASAVARTLLAETGGGDDEAWAYIFNHARDDDRGDQLDREVQRIESATPAELVVIRRELKRLPEAA